MQSRRSRLLMVFLVVVLFGAASMMLQASKHRRLDSHENSTIRLIRHAALRQPKTQIAVKHFSPSPPDLKPASMRDGSEDSILSRYGSQADHVDTSSPASGVPDSGHAPPGHQTVIQVGASSSSVPSMQPTSTSTAPKLTILPSTPPRLPDSMQRYQPMRPTSRWQPFRR